MTTNIQQGTLLDVLKKKMRQTKEEMEKYKDECEEYQKRLQGEVIRREEVSFNLLFSSFSFVLHSRPVLLFHFFFIFEFLLPLFSRLSSFSFHSRSLVRLLFHNFH